MPYRGPGRSNTMPAIDSHPSDEELNAFTLGQLDARLIEVEDHVANCASCQMRAAAAPDDRLVGLLRVVHARDEQGDTVPSGDSRVDGRPPEALANHERYQVLRLLGKG